MTLPIRSLPVVQNWDCHVCGSCCQEYLVTVSDEERRRIEAQDWNDDALLAGRKIFRRTGPWWARRYHLNHRDDGSCVFLSESGRCRMHERFGYESKPLPCRLFPFVLIPAGDHWRVGMRYACPSAAANKGRGVALHLETLKKFATELARREGLDEKPDGLHLRPPRLQGRTRLDWPDTLRLADTLGALIHDRRDPMERRLRKCLALARLCQEAKMNKLAGKRLGDFLQLAAAGAGAEIPADPAALPPPGWVGRILFRQAVALFTRKDHGPNRGIAYQGRLVLLRAAVRFARGRGAIPRMHTWFPETTFEQVEASATRLDEEAELVLERYYGTKVQAFQFCGAANFHFPFWEGLTMLILTFPVLMFVRRALSELPAGEAVVKALSIVDDHFGFNRVLRGRRQRVGLRLLASTGELDRLVAWYSR